LVKGKKKREILQREKGSDTGMPKVYRKDESKRIGDKKKKPILVPFFTLLTLLFPSLVFRHEHALPVNEQLYI